MSETTPVTPPKERRWPRRVGLALLGVLVGCGLAELGFCLYDDGAFPHLNLYTADEELGVRLRPDSTQTFQFQDNPTSEITVNGRGYRGAAWPERTDGEILVVGDSQVFGLGVNDEETFSAQLSEATGRTVINAGVPTYGPPEYTQVVRELIEERRPQTVVYTINVANDFFEQNRPNRARHVVWDGWAVRAETAPESYTDFPMRDWFYRRSHLVYHLRRAMYHLGDQLDDRGFASEGTHRDLVTLGAASADEHEEADEEFGRSYTRRELRAEQIDREILSTKRRVDRLVRGNLGDLIYREEDGWVRYEAAYGNPGDIVVEEAVEEGRAIQLTARIIRRGVMFRERLVGQLLRRPGRARHQTEEHLGQIERLNEQRLAALADPIFDPFVPSVFAPTIEEVADLCQDNEVELVVLVLPLDVQVLPSQWEKYEGDPVDMEPTRVLLTDIVRTSERLGARALDVTEVLRETGDGAFLQGDIHLTASGHEAVATALAATLTQPVPVRLPSAGLPEGRSPVPTPDEFLRRAEAIVRGSSRAGCETVRVREWLRVACLRGRRNAPTGVEVVQGGSGESMAVVTDQATSLTIATLPGERVEADFFWEDRAQRLVVAWGEGDAPEMYFEESRPDEGRPLQESEEGDRLCACHIEVTEERRCRQEFGWPTDDCRDTCYGLYGDVNAGCFAAYEDCESLLRCVRGDPITPPECPEGQVSTTATGACHALCSPLVPCVEGTCTDYQGSAICR